MIFITAKVGVVPGFAERGPGISRDVTEATRAEPGCLRYDWSRSLDDPTEFVLVEAFRDDAAAREHVTVDDFRTAQETLRPHLVGTPRITDVTVPQDGWHQLGELAVDRAS